MVIAHALNIQQYQKTSVQKYYQLVVFKIDTRDPCGKNPFQAFERNNIHIIYIYIYICIYICICMYYRIVYVYSVVY